MQKALRTDLSYQFNNVIVDKQVGTMPVNRSASGRGTVSRNAMNFVTKAY
jgi:hypothetical protein